MSDEQKKEEDREEPEFVFKSGPSDDPNEPSNNQRADWAMSGIHGFLDATGEADNVDEDSIRDLIANLLHLADREGLDTQRILETAIADWTAERE